MVPMATDDPIARELFDLAWKRTIKDLPNPPKARVGPASQNEYLALIRTLVDIADGIEVNLLVAMEQAATVFHVPHAAIGRACGVSRQAVRQRLARAKAAAVRRRSDLSQWDRDYWDDDFD